MERITCEPTLSTVQFAELLDHVRFSSVSVRAIQNIFEA